MITRVAMGSTTADAVLQFINKNYITLQVDDKKYYNEHYLRVLEEFVEQMKFQDELFNEIYEKVVFAGSYYDGLKISKPEEYDVDIVMRLPINYDTLELKCKKVSAGFVKVRATEIDDVTSDTRNNVYKDMYSWTDNDGFLRQDEFRTWMFSVVERTMASLTHESATSAELTIDGETYRLLRRSNGPASTLNITLPSGAKIDVDLVPVIEFKYPLHWPTQVQRNPFPDKESWYIVPKDNSKDKREFRNTYWRLAFHQQEKELIKDKGLLKPVCRLLKKLRDASGLKKVVSYYIKTIFLVTSDEVNDDYWTTTSLSQLFMDMLKALSQCFANRKIGYYWNNKHNLLTGSGMSDAEMSDIHTQLQDIIVDLTKNMSKHPTILAKYLLTETELRKFKWEYLKMGGVPAILVDNINDDRRGSQLSIENRALKKQLSQIKKDSEALVKQMETITKCFNLLELRVENIHGLQERHQSGIGYLFSVAKRNPYF